MRVSIDDTLIVLETLFMSRIVRVWLFLDLTEAAKVAFWNNLLKRLRKMATLSLKSVWQLLMLIHIGEGIVRILR